MLYLAMNATSQILNGYESNTPRTRRAILEVVTLIRDYAARYANAGPATANDDEVWPPASRYDIGELQKNVSDLERKLAKAREDERCGVPGAASTIISLEPQLNLAKSRLESAKRLNHDR